jgi:hypothetical protein
MTVVVSIELLVLGFLLGYLWNELYWLNRMGTTWFVKTWLRTRIRLVKKWLGI